MNQKYQMDGNLRAPHCGYRMGYAQMVLEMKIEKEQIGREQRGWVQSGLVQVKRCGYLGQNFAQFAEEFLLPWALPLPGQHHLQAPFHLYQSSRSPDQR